MHALYVHIPFCVRKCGYCDFYSEVGSNGDAERFLAAIDRELSLAEEAHGRIRPDTVFFGGGTPTKLSAGQLRELGTSLHRHVDLSGVREWTCEINPGTLDAAKAAALVEMGVNRASFGVQSFDPKWLAQLDRSHEAGKVDAALETARAAGIRRLSIDLMFALPGQSLSEWRSDLSKALERQTEHISLYALTYEDDTPLTKRMEAGEVAPTDPDTEAEFFALTVEECAKAGLEHYEVSNFARRGAESLHNLHYWACDDWLGIGPGAHSALGRRRWANAKDHRAYAAALLDGAGSPVAFEETSTAEGFADEMLMMGLRTRRGVDATRFFERTGMTIPDRCGPALDEMERLGLVVWDGRALRPTARGLFVLDAVVLELTRSPSSLSSTGL